MENLKQLQQLYEDYHAESTKVRKSASIFDGLFGLGNDPKKHYCHDLFYENVGKWMKAYLESGPQREEAKAITQFLFEGPVQYRNEDCYWYMFAAIGFMEQLIPLLEKADCAAFAVRFNELYPKIDRLPLQQKIYKQLVKAGK